MCCRVLQRDTFDCICVSIMLSAFVQVRDNAGCCMGVAGRCRRREREKERERDQLELEQRDKCKNNAQIGTDQVFQCVAVCCSVLLCVAVGERSRETSENLSREISAKPRHKLGNDKVPRFVHLNSKSQTQLEECVRVHCEFKI